MYACPPISAVGENCGRQLATHVRCHVARTVSHRHAKPPVGTAYVRGERIPQCLLRIVVAVAEMANAIAMNLKLALLTAAFVNLIALARSAARTGAVAIAAYARRDTTAIRVLALKENVSRTAVAKNAGMMGAVGVVDRAVPASRARTAFASKICVNRIARARIAAMMDAAEHAALVGRSLHAANGNA